MAQFYNADLKPLAPGDSTHSWAHATKLFLADNLRLAPKQSYLYYVCINVDQGILQSLGSIVNGTYEPASSQPLIEQYETGLMAKRVDLPKFQLNTKTINAYNRKNVVQTSIQYNPITIGFHDDAADVVTTFWNDYYTYYYRDSDYDPTLYQLPHKYQSRNRMGWGFTPRNSNLKPFLRNIQIFSLHNKRFTEYLIVNPTITDWRHGEHDSSNDRSGMESTMTVAYETVKYRTGYVNAVDVNGFGILHYDNVQSPISTSTTNIYTDGGLVGALAQGPRDLARPDGTGSGAGLFGGVLNAYRFYNNLKNANLGGVAKQAIGQFGISLLSKTLDGAINSAIFPTGNGAGNGIINAGGRTNLASPYANPLNSYGTTINGLASTLVPGAAISYNNISSTDWQRGVAGPYGAAANPLSRTIYDAQSTNGTIKIDPQTGQPVTGQTTALVLDDNGQPISQFSTVGTQTGTYNPDNITENLTGLQTTRDENNNAVNVYSYRDGTTVVRNADTGEVIQQYPGSGIDINNTNTNPTSTRDIAAAGGAVSPTSPQYYTNPKTGITTTVGGGTTAVITNTVTGTAAAAGGLFAGAELNSALNSTALGKSVLGRTVAKAVSGAAGVVVGRAINNGLQPIVNGLSGKISQGFDSVTGSIKNVVGTWTGTGAFNPSNPTQNIVSKVPDGEGGYIITDKTGSVTYTDGSGNITGSNSSGNNMFGESESNGSNSDQAYDPYGTDNNGNVQEQPVYTADNYESGPSDDSVPTESYIPDDYTA